MDEKSNFCCETFKKSTESGSDNECYGSLTYWNKYKTIPCYEMGSLNEKINFCPWCGDKK